MSGIFITGTDTGVGKTILAGLLGRYLLDRGYRVITQKWIQTGSKAFPEDIDLHLKLMGIKRANIKDYLSYIAPYTFKFASSPHLAARLAKVRISVNKIKNSYRFLSKRFDLVIVEGAGGALVPFKRRRLIIDIAKELKLPVLIVADNRLGAINHTLLTIEALKKRKMRLIGVVFNNRHRDINKIILKDNPEIIKALAHVSVIGTVPWITGLRKI